MVLGVKGKLQLEELYSELLNSDVSINEAIDFLKEKKIEKRPDEIPIEIFQDPNLSGLESIVKYLKEVHALKYSEIAKMLGRDDRTIWTAYNKSKEKSPEQNAPTKTSFSIPINLFKNRLFSVLEHISSHLKDNYNLTYHRIAELLGKNDRTIWTVYNRYLKKVQNG